MQQGFQAAKFAIGFGYEIGLLADFYAVAAFHHDDAIGFADSAEAMGDDEGGAATDEVVDGFLDFAFANNIERAGRFVENNDGGIRRIIAPCNSNALALAAG